MSGNVAFEMLEHDHFRPATITFADEMHQLAIGKLRLAIIALGKCSTK